MKINSNVKNRQILRSHAAEAVRAYSPVMTWLTLDQEGDLFEIIEPQGQSFYTGDDEVVATTGSFEKAHGQGACEFKTQKAYLKDLLGEIIFKNIFGK